MKSSPAAKHILFVALNKKEAGLVLDPLRTAGHLVSLVEDLGAAQTLLASHGFDQAVVPAPVLESLLQQRALWEATDSEAWRRSTAGIAHDLRSLLNALEGSIDELGKEGRGREGTAASLDEIRRRVSVLSTFLHELILELSNGTNDELNLTAIDLEDAVEAAAITVYPTASEKQQRLVIDIDEEVSNIRADGTKLKRVLTNLLDYAARNTPPMGTVAVHACREQDECVISVSHEGEGATQSELRRLFRPPLEPEEATGPSLSRVKRMVEQHRGRVWVESQKGCGTTLFVSLPQPAKARGRRSRTRSLASD